MRLLSLYFIRAGITPAIKDVLPVMDMEEHSTLGDHEGHQGIFDIMIAS